MKLLFPFVALAGLVSSNVHASDSLLRSKTPEVKQLKDETESGLLAKLLEKIESLESRIDELEDAMEVVQSMNTRRRLDVDPECVIKYNSATGMCHANNTFAFDHHVEIMEGFTASGDVELAGKLYMMDGGEVRGGTLEANSPVLFTRGLEVRGGLISFNTTTKMGNLTVDGTTVVGKTTFMDPVEFLASVDFEDKVDFNDNVDFHGHEIDFYAEVYFKEDVCFEDDTVFKDDVEIYGPTSDDTSESSTDFEIHGYVNVDFKQKKPMDVYPQTRFRDDVHLVHGPSSSSSTSHTSSSSSSGSSSDSRSSSSDYSTESHDTIPQLKVDGDITSNKNVNVGENLHVGGTTAFKMSAEVEGDLTVTGTGDFGEVTTDSLTVDGTTMLNGATTVTTGNLEVDDGNIVLASGGITATDGDISLTDGSISVTNGNIDVEPDPLLDTNGNVNIGGDLTVDGTAGGAADWQFPI